MAAILASLAKPISPETSRGMRPRLIWVFGRSTAPGGEVRWVGAEMVRGNNLMGRIHRDLGVITWDEPALARHDPAVAIGEVRQSIGSAAGQGPRSTRSLAAWASSYAFALADVFEATLLVRHPLRCLVAPALRAVLGVLGLVRHLGAGLYFGELLADQRGSVSSSQLSLGPCHEMWSSPTLLVSRCCGHR
jgi:hypothetical protein